MDETELAIREQVEEHGVDKLCSREGNAFIHIYVNHLKYTKLLVDELGANIHLRAAKTRQTPLMYAVQWGEIEVIHYLLDKGAKVNVCDSKKNQALDFAVDGIRCRHDSLAIRLLMKYGAKRGPCREASVFNEEEVALYQGISTLIVLLPPIYVSRFHRPIWPSRDCLRLLGGFLFSTG